MQTFLVYSNFRKSARHIDNKRLGKQLIETKQIYDTIVNNKKAWSGHPAVKMWREYELALLLYGVDYYEEWKERYVLGLRGGKLNHKSGEEILNEYYRRIGKEEFKFPVWIYDEKLLTSHKSNLIRKNPDYYNRFWPSVPNNIPYFWPV